MTYQLSDPWQEMFKPVCGVLPESSVFKSSSKRLFDQGDKSSSLSRSTPIRASTAPQNVSRTAQRNKYPLPNVSLDNMQSLSLVESLGSWNSAAFDKLGDNGSLRAQKPQTPHYISHPAPQPNPRQASRPSSPDLIITSLLPDSHELIDHLHPVLPDRSAVMSRGRSSEGLRRREQSHLPGPSIAPRLSPPRSPVQRQEDEDAFSLRKIKVHMVSFTCFGSGLLLLTLTVVLLSIDVFGRSGRR